MLLLLNLSNFLVARALWMMFAVWEFDPQNESLSAVAVKISKRTTSWVWFDFLHRVKDLPAEYKQHAHAWDAYNFNFRCHFLLPLHAVHVWPAALFLQRLARREWHAAFALCLINNDCLQRIYQPASTIALEFIVCVLDALQFATCLGYRVSGTHASYSFLILTWCTGKLLAQCRAMEGEMNSWVTIWTGEGQSSASLINWSSFFHKTMHCALTFSDNAGT